MHKIIFSSILVSVIALGAGCASSRPVKEQAYAKLSDHRTFEYEFPAVWKGIESAFREYKVSDRNPDQVDDLEIKKLKKRTLETDWIYAQSRDKYIEYKVNGSPRKKYLQTRIKYSVKAESQIGGTDVSVKTDEQIEKLKEDGSPAGYDSVDHVDSSRANEVLDKINQAILSAAP